MVDWVNLIGRSGQQSRFEDKSTRELDWFVPETRLEFTIVRGTVVTRTYGTHTETYIFLYFFFSRGAIVNRTKSCEH